MAVIPQGLKARAGAWIGRAVRLEGLHSLWKAFSNDWWPMLLGYLKWPGAVMTGGWTWLEWHSVPVAVTLALGFYASARFASLTRGVIPASSGAMGVGQPGVGPSRAKGRLIDLDPTAQEEVKARENEITQLRERVAELESWKEKKDKEVSAALNIGVNTANLIMWERQKRDLVRQQKYLSFVARDAKSKHIESGKTKEEVIEDLRKRLIEIALDLKSRCGVYEPIEEMNRAIVDANFDLRHSNIEQEDFDWALRHHECKRLQVLAENRDAELTDSLAELRRWLKRRGQDEAQRRNQNWQA
jgi:molybdopterin converting factor small subunit